MIVNGNKIIPAEGKRLYNGEICSDTVYLGKDASADDWQEVDEYIEPDAEQPTPEEDEATIEDYEEALGRFGV